MRISKLVAALAVAAAAVTLSACSQQTPATPQTSASASTVIAPVVMDVNDLQGATVELVVGQVLDIDTGDLAVDSYTGDVEDTSVAEFVAGKDDGSATFNPGVSALAEGSTKVVLSNDDGGIQDVTFTVSVTQP